MTGALPSIAFPKINPAELGLAYTADVTVLDGTAGVSIDIPSTAPEGVPHPALTLSYASGAGGSAFGVGWSVGGVHAISVNTRKGCPRYTEADRFVASGAGELILARDDGGTARTIAAPGFRVDVYRPRRDGHAVRVERWTDIASGAVHFRMRDARDVVTVFGSDPAGASRIFDPTDPSRVFSWLAEAEFHPDGRCVAFEHVAEDTRQVDTSLTFEQGRQSSREAQRYLKRIRYGNVTPVAPGDDLAAVRWSFEIVFDYGDHADDAPQPEPDQAWPARVDPSSIRTPGFEVRTYRLCRRILFFHHLADTLLVGALRLEHEPHPAGTTLRSLRYTGYRAGAPGGQAEQRSLPQLSFDYTRPSVAEVFEPAAAPAMENVPHGLAGPGYRWVDLYGEGLPGILAEGPHAWYFKRNEGGGAFGPQQVVVQQPSGALATATLGDFSADGNPKLAILQGREGGYYELDRDTGLWGGFQPFELIPHMEALAGRVQWLDLDADGRADLVVTRPDRVTYFPCLGRRGFDDAIEVTRENQGAASLAAPLAESTSLSFFFADMTGDGLSDQVRVQNGRVEYWPSLGNGRFGEPVVMDGAPMFAPEGEFDARRLLFVDLDGSGTSDLVYVGKDGIRLWINACGNQLIDGGVLADLPVIDNLSSLHVLDFLADGTPCLVWSSPLPSGSAPLEYLPLTSGVKPRLLASLDDGHGRVTEFAYSTSATHYLRDCRQNQPWRTHIPSHPVVVDALTIIDRIGGHRATQRYAYHDGYYDGEERAFRGFGRVDVFDTEVLEASAGLPETVPTAPACARTWHFLGDPRFEPPAGAYALDPAAPELSPFVIDGPALTAVDEYDDALRALAGSVIRKEIFAVGDDGELHPHPFQVVQQSYRVRRLQAPQDGHEGAYRVHTAETLDTRYEQRADDPRATHDLVLGVDDFGIPTLIAKVGYPRRATAQTDCEAQRTLLVTVERHRVENIDHDDRYEIGLPIEQQVYELRGLAVPAAGCFSVEDLRDEVLKALGSPLLHHQPFSATGPQARLSAWQRTMYWDSGQSRTEPLGSVGRPSLVHHEDVACFTPDFLTNVLGDHPGAPAPALSDLGYHEDAGHHFRSDETVVYLDRGGFHRVASTRRWDGAETVFTYDAGGLSLIRHTDAAQNTTAAEIDPYTLAPRNITDPNGTIAEVRYDALGVPIASSWRGQVLDDANKLVPYGFNAVDGWAPPAITSLADALARVDQALGGVAAVTWYDLSSTPPCLLHLAQESLLHDGTASPPAPRAQVEVTYLDGFRREMQTRRAVEPGADGKARWLVSGLTLYDRKQQEARHYVPYFAPGASFEAAPATGPFVEIRHDATGREIERSMPGGLVARAVFSAWSTEHHDPNDNVVDSGWGKDRAGLPVGDVEREALERTRAHAGTARRVCVDALGREVRTEEASAVGAKPRVTEVALDVNGEVRSQIDPRGLTTFVYHRDMAQRVLRVDSTDAGTTWTLVDALGRDAQAWNGRGLHVARSFDELDRPTSVVVDEGTGPRMVEAMRYEDGPGATAGANARGQLVEHRDAAGVVVVRRYAPSGEVLEKYRQLCQSAKVDADWVALSPEQWVSLARYDAMGRPVEQQLPDKMVRRMGYLRGGGLGRLSIAGTGGELVETVVLDHVEMNARGQRERAVLGNGVELKTRYDAAFRADRVSALRGGVALQDLRLTYDPAGNVMRTVDAAQGADSACVYTYDALYQLVEAAGRLHPALTREDEDQARERAGRRLSPNDLGAVRRYRRTYAYDAAGNRERMDHSTLGTNGPGARWVSEMWISRRSNRSVPRVDPSGTVVSEAVGESRFDAAGNLRFLPHVAGMSLSWAGRLRETVVVKRGAGEVDDANWHVYGGDGQQVRWVSERLLRASNGSGPGAVVEVTEKLYLDGCEVTRVSERAGGGEKTWLERRTSVLEDESGVVARMHWWGKDEKKRETDDPGKVAFRYPVTGVSPSVRLELDGSGKVVSYEEYFPFGGTAFVAAESEREVSLKENRFSGKAQDKATGLYDFGMRHYAPWMGRWVSPDPIGPEDHENLYVAMRNNPATLADEEGLYPGCVNHGTNDVPFWLCANPEEPEETIRNDDSNPNQDPATKIANVRVQQRPTQPDSSSRPGPTATDVPGYKCNTAGVCKLQESTPIAGSAGDPFSRSPTGSPDEPFVTGNSTPAFLTPPAPPAQQNPSEVPPGTPEDDRRLQEVGITRQQLFDFLTMSRGAFAEKHGPGGILAPLLFYRNFRENVYKLPLDLLARTLPKEDETVYWHGSGRMGTKRQEATARVREFTPGTPIGAVTYVSARVVWGFSHETARGLSAFGDLAGSALPGGRPSAGGGAAAGRPTTYRVPSSHRKSTNSLGVTGPSPVRNSGTNMTPRVQTNSAIDNAWRHFEDARKPRPRLPTEYDMALADRISRIQDNAGRGSTQKKTWAFSTNPGHFGHSRSGHVHGGAYRVTFADGTINIGRRSYSGDVLRSFENARDAMGFSTLRLRENRRSDNGISGITQAGHAELHLVAAGYRSIAVSRPPCDLRCGYGGGCTLALSLTQRAEDPVFLFYREKHRARGGNVEYGNWFIHPFPIGAGHYVEPLILARMRMR